MNATTINGQRVQVLDRFVSGYAGENRIEAIKIRGVSISFPEELIRGRVVAVVPKLKDTELHVFYRSKSSISAFRLSVVGADIPTADGEHVRRRTFGEPLIG